MLRRNKEGALRGNLSSTFGRTETSGLFFGPPLSHIELHHSAAVGMAEIGA